MIFLSETDVTGFLNPGLDDVSVVDVIKSDTSRVRLNFGLSTLHLGTDS